MAISPRRIQLRHQFRFKLEFPVVSDQFRSLRLTIMLPGVFIHYAENAPCWYYPHRVESGCQIGVFNPLARRELGAELPLLPSFWDAMRPRYVRAPYYPDTHWVEVPDGWSGKWERGADGREQPVL